MWGVRFLKQVADPAPHPSFLYCERRKAIGSQVGAEVMGFTRRGGEHGEAGTERHHIVGPAGLLNQRLATKDEIIDFMLTAVL